MVLSFKTTRVSQLLQLRSKVVCIVSCILSVMLPDLMEKTPLCLVKMINVAYMLMQHHINHVGTNIQ